MAHRGRMRYEREGTWSFYEAETRKASTRSAEKEGGAEEGWARLTGGAHHFCVRAAVPPPALPLGGVIGERGTAARREGKNALGVCSGGAPRTCTYLHEGVHLLNVILGRQWCLRCHRWSVSGEAAAEGPVPCGWRGRSVGVSLIRVEDPSSRLSAYAWEGRRASEVDDDGWKELFESVCLSAAYTGVKPVLSISQR